ncbi:MAG: ABC transporter substrate-binding protein, partial [Burkholderiales bacterium]
KAFVDEFEKKYGYLPSYYSEQSYDAIMLINSAVKAVKGNLDDKKGLIAAMEKADFTWTRPNFHFNTNHIPIQNFYLFRVDKNAKDQYYRKVEATIFTNHKDAYYGECPMK